MFHLLQRLILSIGFNLILMITLSAQTNNLSAGSNGSLDTNVFHLNPLLRSAFNNTIKANPLVAKFIKPTKYELMRWSNYFLTAAQIEARQREWDRNNNLPIGQQIAKDAIDIFIMQPLLYNAVNSLIYGRKTSPAVVPKF